MNDLLTTIADTTLQLDDWIKDLIKADSLKEDGRTPLNYEASVVVEGKRITVTVTLPNDRKVTVIDA